MYNVFLPYLKHQSFPCWLVHSLLLSRKVAKGLRGSRAFLETGVVLFCNRSSLTLRRKVMFGIDPLFRLSLQVSKGVTLATELVFQEILTAHMRCVSWTEYFPSDFHSESRKISEREEDFAFYVIFEKDFAICISKPVSAKFPVNVTSAVKGIGLLPYNFSRHAQCRVQDLWLVLIFL